MATGNASCCSHADDDFIDMDLSPLPQTQTYTHTHTHSTNLICFSINSSPPQSREFEFQMCTSLSQDTGGGPSSLSPADELFYKGKLLPLHLPPRLQMVQSLLLQTTPSNTKTQQHQHDDDDDNNDDDENFIAITPSLVFTSSSTQLGGASCNISFSPSESCKVSCELNPPAVEEEEEDQCLFDWSTAKLRGTADTKKDYHHHHHYYSSWSKKLKQSSLCQKLKASRTYLKSLFTKSGCSSECCAKASTCAHAGDTSKTRKYTRVSRRAPYAQDDGDTCIVREFCESNHRKSFSGAIQRHCTTKLSSSSSLSSGSSSTSSSSSSSSSLSSSSSSFSLNGLYDLQLLRRSSSANSDLESSIEGAIAHCKQSHSTKKVINECVAGTWK